MLAVTELGMPHRNPLSLLDVGCGYGSLLDLIHERRMSVDYHGIDLCEPMIQAAREKFPNARWSTGDILKLDATENYDYVVCNGILTQKLDASIRQMDEYAKALVTKMFSLCNIGIAFNTMTTHVNFMAQNLYYRNPVELLAWCMTELTPRIRMDHAYPMFEYTLYLYREDAPGLGYGAHRKSTG
ncbi:MAG: class I SAM-dependent methyltransferase [Pseudomonadota bacterium]